MLLYFTTYCVDGEKRECCRMWCFDTAAQTKTEDTAECRQNNNIAETITHKPIQHNK